MASALETICCQRVPSAGIACCHPSTSSVPSNPRFKQRQAAPMFLSHPSVPRDTRDHSVPGRTTRNRPERFRSAARAIEPQIACLGTTIRWRWRESNPRPKQCPENVYKLSRRIMGFSRLRIPGDGDEGASRWSWAALSTSGCCIPQCLTASRKPAGGIPVDRDPT